MMKPLWKVVLFLWLFPCAAWAQINTDRVMLMGRNALYYEDYVLSIRRFNMVIAAKPYLAEPYFYRGLAKFYLEDYVGAEEDCGAAIDRNPFLPDNYELRGLCRINLKRYADAISDYRNLLRIEPKAENGWHNMTLCYLELKEYGKAVGCLDTMLAYWPKKAQLYTMKAQVYLAEKDTAAAMASADKALAINPYEGQAWNIRAVVYAAREQYKEAEEALDKTIQQMPRQAGHYVNRALMRYHQRNLRGAMEDYDTALEMDSTNYVGHFNRGLLRAQVGDDNRAIEDFNFVLRLEPDNMIALFNRALMLDNTGDYKGAIRDIDAVIKEFPNFWTGYQFRAEVRRKMGDVKGAERDEFKVLKAQMDMRYGGKKPQSTKRTRKASDRDMEDYDKLVEADTSGEEVPEYESEYRGKVQNRRTQLSIEPALVLTYYVGNHDFRRNLYNKDIENLNRAGLLPGRLFLTHDETALDETQVQRHFASIRDLTEKITAQPENALLYFARSLDEYLVKDFEKALADADRAVALDEQFTLARYLRLQIRMKALEVREKSGEGRAVARQTPSPAGWEYDAARVEHQAALDDCDRILAREPDFAAVYYNKGNVYVQMKLWPEAIEAYTQAIGRNSAFAEAYYNRGVAHILSGNYADAVSDLSQAGEMGLYKAYNLIKQYREKALSQAE